jgi:hypothetical protein
MIQRIEAVAPAILARSHVRRDKDELPRFWNTLVDLESRITARPEFLDSHVFNLRQRRGFRAEAFLKAIEFLFNSFYLDNDAG